jgi:hypothetical protein
MCRLSGEVKLRLAEYVYLPSCRSLSSASSPLPTFVEPHLRWLIAPSLLPAVQLLVVEAASFVQVTDFNCLWTLTQISRFFSLKPH